MSHIKRDLLLTGSIREDDLEVFSETTRDAKVRVYRDRLSGVIFIPEVYVGDETYALGSYREEDPHNTLEDVLDSQRRFLDLQPIITGARVLDFGCGAGGFLRKAQPIAESVCGVELQDSYRSQLLNEGIECHSHLESLTDMIDVLCMFHVFEHIPQPIALLEKMKRLLDPNRGVLVVEVPNANDYLLLSENRDFKDFTLWSQHLVLHTRDSIRRMLRYAGFRDIRIRGIQRFPASNNLHWQQFGRPGGHKGREFILDDPALHQVWEARLAALDETDTLFIVARV